MQQGREFMQYQPVFCPLSSYSFFFIIWLHFYIIRLQLNIFQFQTYKHADLSYTTAMTEIYLQGGKHISY